MVKVGVLRRRGEAARSQELGLCDLEALRDVQRVMAALAPTMNSS